LGKKYQKFIVTLVAGSLVTPLALAENAPPVPRNFDEKGDYISIAAGFTKNGSTNSVRAHWSRRSTARDADDAALDGCSKVGQPNDCHIVARAWNGGCLYSTTGTGPNGVVGWATGDTKDGAYQQCLQVRGVTHCESATGICTDKLEIQPAK
jgi:hypothetical protein